MHMIRQNEMLPMVLMEHGENPLALVLRAIQDMLCYFSEA